MAEPTLSISSDKVCFLVVKAREFDVQDLRVDEESASHPVADRMIDVLEEHADDPTLQEIQEFIESLSEDEQVDLVALMRLGRGDGTLAEWDELRGEAQTQYNAQTTAYLLGEPLVADYLEEGLALFGLSCEDAETGRL